MILRFLNARFVLGLALMRNLVLRLFTRRGGAKAWLGTIARERLAPTAPQAWRHYAASSRCIGCGLCDSVARDNEAPSEWILGVARQAEDAPLAQDKAVRLRALAEAIAKVCPARVPTDEVAGIIEDNVRMLAAVIPRDGG